MVSRKAERIMRIILREREERAQQDASELACREAALAAVRRATEPLPELPVNPEDYDRWFAQVKAARRRK